MDDFVASIVIARLSTAKFRRKLEAVRVDPSVEGLHRRRSALDAVADNMAEAFGSGEMDRRAYRVAAARNQAEREEVERELASKTAGRLVIPADVPSTEVGLIKWWEAADVQHRSALVRVIIQTITVSPAIRGRRTFDPDRLEIAWRES